MILCVWQICVIGPRRGWILVLLFAACNVAGAILGTTASDAMKNCQDLNSCL